MFEFTLTETVDGFFGVDFYNPRMYPDNCKSKSSSAFMNIYLDGNFVQGRPVSDDLYYAFIRNNWLPGQYTVIITNSDWDTVDVKDFSFRTFLPVSVDITLRTFNSSADLDFAKDQLDLPASKS